MATLQVQSGKEQRARVEAALVQSGMSAPRTAAARVGYLPLPLEQVLVQALARIPIYLHTAGARTAEAQRFTLYTADSARFAEEHRGRLMRAGVKFIYIPMSHQKQFQEQVETELVTLAADPEMALSTKSAIMYGTSIELIDEVLSEQGIQKNLPRLVNVAKSVSTLVMNDTKAFSHLFATSQHDFYTATHCVNVGTWMTSLAYVLGVTKTAELEAVCMAGMLHDVGKMFVPGEVLNKSGSLADREWAMLRDHPRRGYEHLKSEGITDELVLRVTLEHHERVDGTGYPHGIKGEQMHRISQVCAVVDSFDAMTACRPFKNRVKTVAEAVGILQSETPGKYDAEVVKAWVGLLKKASNDGMLAEPVEEEKREAGAGRRAHERHAVECAAKIYPLKRGERVEGLGGGQRGMVHNISQGGLGLLVNREIMPSTYVRVELEGKGTLEGMVVEGQVVRCRAYGDGQFDLGVRKCEAATEGEAGRRAVSQGS